MFDKIFDCMNVCNTQESTTNNDYFKKHIHLPMMNSLHGLCGHFILFSDWKAPIETDGPYTKTDKARMFIL